MKSWIKNFASYVLVVLAILFSGCGERVDSVKDEPIYDTYLSISTTKPFTDYTSEDWDIIDEARIRMGIVINSDGLMSIMRQSAKEINVSEELYQIIKRMVDNGNNLIIDASHSATRAVGDNACVANCIIEMGRRLGGNVNGALVKQWIYNVYDGLGVPPGDVYDVVNRFLVAVNLPLPLTTAVIGGGPIMLVVLGAHAVVLNELRGDNTIYVFDQELVRDDTDDPSNGCTIIPLEYVSQAILAISVR